MASGSFAVAVGLCRLGGSSFYSTDKRVVMILNLGIMKQRSLVEVGVGQVVDSK